MNLLFEFKLFLKIIKLFNEFNTLSLIQFRFYFPNEKYEKKYDSIQKINDRVVLNQFLSINVLY